MITGNWIEGIRGNQNRKAILILPGFWQICADFFRLFAFYYPAFDAF